MTKRLPGFYLFSEMSQGQGRNGEIGRLERAHVSLCEERQKIYCEIFDLNQLHISVMEPYRRRYHTLVVERKVLELEQRCERKHSRAQVAQRREYVEEARQALVAAYPITSSSHPSLSQKQDQLIHLLAATAEDVRNLRRLHQQQAQCLAQFRAKTRDLVEESRIIKRRQEVEKKVVDLKLIALCERLNTVETSLERLRKEEEDERAMVLLPVSRSVYVPGGIWNTRSDLHKQHPK